MDELTAGLVRDIIMGIDSTGRQVLGVLVFSRLSLLPQAYWLVAPAVQCAALCAVCVGVCACVCLSV